MNGAMQIAEIFGISRRLKELKAKIEELPSVKEISTFDLDGYFDDIKQIIFIAKLDEDYLSATGNYAKEYAKKDIVGLCRKLGLERTTDSIEDYDDAWYFVFDSSKWEADDDIQISAVCAVCGKEGVYTLKGKETVTFREYMDKGRSMGYLQDLFPNVPNWIRSGAIDTMSSGFCICPDCGV